MAKGTTWIGVSPFRPNRTIQRLMSMCSTDLKTKIYILCRFLKKWKKTAVWRGRGRLIINMNWVHTWKGIQSFSPWRKSLFLKLAFVLGKTFPLGSIWDFQPNQILAQKIYNLGPQWKRKRLNHLLSHNLCVHSLAHKYSLGFFKNCLSDLNI